MISKRWRKVSAIECFRKKWGLTFGVLNDLGVAWFHDGAAGIRRAEIDTNDVTIWKQKAQRDACNFVRTWMNKMRQGKQRSTHLEKSFFLIVCRSVGNFANVINKALTRKLGWGVPLRREAVAVSLRRELVWVGCSTWLLCVWVVSCCFKLSSCTLTWDQVLIWLQWF